MTQKVYQPVGDQTERFEDVVLPHLDAAHGLARWLMRNEQDAEDVVQDAALRAFRYFRTFTGGNGRAWFLTIVRNTCCDLRGGCVDGQTEPFDEELHSSGGTLSDPEAMLCDADTAALITRAMGHLPFPSRELLTRRELEGLSYRELAHVMGIPIGTVMSRLSRARGAFHRALGHELSSSLSLASRKTS